uniref:RING-type domain-containing protein n=1 Tax=Caenorhabditis tropicalis TaxID=1561998 RepID=A0A1I7SYD8_9PELO
MADVCKWSKCSMLLQLELDKELKRVKEEAAKKAEEVLMLQQALRHQKRRAEKRKVQMEKMRTQMASCAICWNPFSDELKAVSARCGHLCCLQCSQHIVDRAAIETNRLRALERQKPNRHRVYVRKVKAQCPMCRGLWSHLKKVHIRERNCE